MIDLCVVNHNTSTLLERLFDHLHKNISVANKSWKLYLADNDSTDNTIDWLKNKSSQYQIDGLCLNKNIGYSAACNQLAARGSSEIIGLLNADVWLTNSDVNCIKDIFDSDPTIHILGPKQRDEHGLIRHAGIIGTNTAPKHRGWMEPDMGDRLYRDRVKCVTVSGSAYFIRRYVWNNLTYNQQYRQLVPNAVGAFLPTPHYYEETWCSYFARHLGYNVVYDGSVSIGHSWHASSPKPGEGYSHADAQFKVSQSIFRNACDHMGIERD